MHPPDPGPSSHALLHRFLYPASSQLIEPTSRIHFRRHATLAEVLPAAQKGEKDR
jgi:hypothetical protein